jgi:thioredoxin reductase
MMVRSSFEPDFDVIIVGGGPAGLSAALVLGRCLRSVLVVDAGHPRNYASRAAHNFLTREGIEPIQLLRLGRAEIQSYGVCLEQRVVKSARRVGPGFEIELADGTRRSCRKLLIATGVCDVLPDIPNVKALYGLGVHHCPYCDAYEYRGHAMAAYGEGGRALGLAENLRTWSERVTAVTDGPFPRRDRRRAQRLGIAVRVERVLKLESVIGTSASGEPVFGDPRHEVPVEAGALDRLGRVVFESGPPLEVAAFFFNTGQLQRSQLPFALGCRKDAEGGVRRDRRQRTGVPGLYLAGDASRDVQFIVVAAAEGARAGMSINADLQAEFTAAVLTGRNPALSAEMSRPGTPRTSPQLRSGG